MLLSDCAVCNSKNFIKEQQASGLLSSLWIKLPNNSFIRSSFVLGVFNELIQDIKLMKYLTSFY